MRALVDVPDQQIDELKEVCELENISRAEAIRRAISEYLSQHKAEDSNALGLWKKHDKQVDGLEYQQKMREQW